MVQPNDFPPSLPERGDMMHQRPRSVVPDQVMLQNQARPVAPVPVQWHPNAEQQKVNPYMPVARVLPAWDAWQLHPDNPNRMKRLPIAFLYSIAHHFPSSGKWLAIYGVGGLLALMALGGIWNGRTTVAGPGYRNPGVNPGSYFVPSVDYQSR